MSTICDTFLITKCYHCSQTMDLHAYISIHHCKLVLRSFCSACSATKRRPIKGAAGRPVQFKYPEMPLLSPTTLERQEIQQRLVPLWVRSWSSSWWSACCISSTHPWRSRSPILSLLCLKVCKKLLSYTPQRTNPPLTLQLRCATRMPKKVHSNLPQALVSQVSFRRLSF